MPKIGSGQITLADLTDQRPIRLDLATSLQIIQAQTGTVYNPDYSEKRNADGQIIQEGQIIIPSLFLGQEEINPTQYFNKIIYNCSDEGDAIDYSYEEGFDPSSNENSYVDKLGRFHLRRNLTKNITIEATINGIKDNETGVFYSSTSEKISLYQVNYESGYSNFILSEDGRYDFEEGNTNDIKLISKLYYGAEIVPENQVEKYEWFRSEDGTTPISGESSASFIVQRSMVYGHETFICQITLKSGMIFREQVKIDDRTDSYHSIILADGSTILTPLLNKVSLSCQIWQGNNEFNENNIRYNWYYIIDKEIIDFNGDNFKEISIVLDGNDKYEVGTNILTSIETIGEEVIVHLPKASLTIYCQAIILDRDKIISKPINFMPIQYTQAYTVVLNPESIFIPANGDGSFRGTSFEKQIKFSLIDESGKPLKYVSDTSNLILPILSFNEGKSEEEQENSIKFSFQEQPTGANADWIFTLLMRIDTNESLKEWDSIVGTIQYQYLGAWFSKSFDIIKNTQGIAGKTGYTIDLTNSFHKFAGEERYALLGQETNFGYIAKIAEEDLTIESIIIPTITFPSGEIIYDSDPAIGDGDSSYKEIVSGLFITYNHAEKLFYLKTADKGTSNAHYLEIEDGNFFIDFKVSHSSFVKPITFRKLFTYGYTKTRNSYSLYISPNVLTYSNATDSYDTEEITVRAQYQSQGVGMYLPYAQGIIKYSTDGENYTTLINGEPFYTNSLTKTEKSIIFRLYSKDDRDNVILDEETVPILTSIDGAVIGGENLLKWTKELPISNNKWLISSHVTRKENEGFGCLKFFANSFTSDSWLNIKSPKSNFLQEYLGQVFCLSFDVKVSDEVTLDGTFAPYIVFNSDYNNISRERYGRIFSFDKNGIIENYNNSHAKFHSKFEKNKWIHVSATFTIPNAGNTTSFSNTDNSLLDLTSCKYFSIFFYLSKNGSVEIKKPKLERGNIPTDWSANFEDVTYEDVAGTNLIQGNTSQLEIDKIANENSRYLLTDNLKANTVYTFSYYSAHWDSISPKDENTFRLELHNSSGRLLQYKMLSEVNNSRKIQTFTVPSGSSFYLYIYPSGETSKGIAEKGILRLEKVKLEKGENATSYFVGEEYLNNLIVNLQDSTDQNFATINGINGKFQTSLDELENTLSELSGSMVTIDDVNGRIESSTSQFITRTDEYDARNTWIEQLQGKIEINSSDVTEPYIEISTRSGTDNLYSIKITDNQLLFNQGGKTVAEINNNYLKIKRGLFEEDLLIGTLRVAITESGVGFMWGG